MLPPEAVWNPTLQRWEFADEPAVPGQEAGNRDLGPPPARAPQGRRPRRAALWSAAVVGVLVVVVWYVRSDGDEDPENARRGPGSSATVPLPSPSSTPPPPTGAPSSSAPQPPSPPFGFRIDAGPKSGVTLAVPRTWTRREDTDSAIFESSDRLSFLVVIHRSTGTTRTPLSYAQEASRVLRPLRPHYEETRLGHVSGASGAAELVYAYDYPESGGRRRGIFRVFVTSDLQTYALHVAGPQEDWPRQRQVLDAALTGSYAP
ncbi:hypothetical protein [Streptomyces sp. NPDC006879]|uniref:hypothetical protein n=1 Tax=Streptomyces sp. NPDC006879 TaxID=3364767 RepID=UPI0036B7FFD8